jgi:hypothetical protein
MAFSSAPEKDTYSSERIPMAWPLKLRPGNQNYLAAATPLQVQDEGMVNALPINDPSKEEGPLTAVTRPAMNGTYVNNTSEAGIVRGMYVWEKTAGTVYFFMVVGTKVYTTTGTGTIPIATTWTQVDTLLTSATTPVRFTEFISATNVKSLVLVDGVEGYVYTSNAAGTKIVSADFPTPHVPFPVFLNGRLYLAKSNTGDIYNSNLNDPAAWTAGDFISTEVYPDDIQALIKTNNYLLAVGTQSSEFFSDAANATGTPLARYDGGLLPFGCLFPNSIASNKDTSVLLANTNDGQTVFKAIEGFKHAEIESSSIVPTYNRMLRNPNVGFEIPAANCRGYFFRQGGVLYYNFLFDGVRQGAFRTALFDACYTYSFGAKVWTELQYGNNTTDRDLREAFPVQVSAPATTGYNSTYIAGNIGTAGIAFFGVLDDLLGTDTVTPLNNQALYVEFRTPNLDFGTLNRKFMHRLGVMAECNDSTLVTLWNVMWNDQDYKYTKWVGPVPLTAAADATSQDHWPFITQLGQFRRRAIRLYCTTGKVLTAKYIEVDINKGQQ